MRWRRRWQRRRLLTTAVALGLAVVPAAVACGGGDDERADPDVAGPSPVTEGDTTTAPSTVLVTLAPTTPTTAAPTTPPPTPAPTQPPPTASPTPPPIIGGYQPVEAPAFPTRTSPPPTGDEWPDGDYYVVVRGAAADAPTPRVAITAYQLLTGPDAIAAAQADGVGLDSDVYVPPEPFADRDLELVPDLALSVARPDRPAVSYAVTAGELARLVDGGGPASDAPAGYEYVPFPYLLSVQGGRPVALQQLWAP